MSDFKLNTFTTPLQNIKLEVAGGIAKDGSLSRVRCDKAHIKEVGDVKVTERFMTSLAGLMGLGSSVFRYFKPDEVFDRVIKAAPRNTNIQITVDDKGNLLAAISPGKETLGMKTFNEVMDATHPRGFTYHNGVVKLLYGVDYNGGMTIGGEDFKKQFTMTIPLDGYGEAFSNLAFLRQVCENGMEILNTLFSSRVGLGTKGKRSAPIINYVQNYNNDESFSVIEDRLVTAMSSPASLGEYARLLGALQLGAGDPVANKELDRAIYTTLTDIGGNPMSKYGLVSLDSLSDKKLMLLNTDCKVYDLIQLATEVSTHQYNKGDLMRRRVKLDKYVSDLLTNEYDMEVVEAGANFASTKLNGRQFFLTTAN